MKRFLQLLILTLVGLFMAACSSTYMSGSWADSSYQGQIKNVYLIGVAKQEVNRRIFEDTFSHQLADSGVKGTASYNDLPSDMERTKETIKQRMVANGADSVLITKLTGQRSETVTSPGYASGYSSYGRGGYGGSRSRGGWGNYSRSYDVVYQPPTTTNFVILTVESVLYDLKTEEMIWSAQLETVVEGNLEKMMQDYVETVTKDLKEKGLI
jgi:hypothetical protein